MKSAAAGQRCRVLVPLADDGFPADVEVNRALGRPDCAMVNDIWVLHHEWAVVYQSGLRTAGGLPGTLVGFVSPDGGNSPRVQLLPTAWLASGHTSTLR